MILTEPEWVRTVIILIRSVTLIRIFLSPPAAMFEVAIVKPKSLLFSGEYLENVARAIDRGEQKSCVKSEKMRKIAKKGKRLLS